MTMRREIGSEFWDVPTINQKNNLFPESTQWYLSGRSALQAIIADLGEARSVSLPSWCCDSMIKPFIDAGLEANFYPVYWSEGRLIQEWSFDCDVLFLIDYFGYTGAIPDLNGFKGTVIRDVTHSLFSKTYSDADYYFGSLRKWCGVWTGGYAWAKDGRRLRTGLPDDGEYVSFREKAMLQKAEYISGQREDKSYLQIFEEAEGLLESVDSSAAADRDIQIAKKLDIKIIKNRRRANAEILRSAFPDWLIFSEQSPNDVPMFVPVLIPGGKRNELRRYLINNEIYCPIHWPVSDFHRLDGKEQFIYDNELSLVCDQRYKEEDMYRMVETIKVFWKEA